MDGTFVRHEPGRLERTTVPLDLRLLRRLPRLAALMRRAVFRLPPSSPLRGAFMRRVFRVGYCAYECGEIAGPVELFYSPEVVMHAELGDIGPDMDNEVHGKDGVRRWIEVWQDGFESVRWETTELLDFGDTVMFSLHQVAQGRASGIRTELTSHAALRFEDGLVVWQSWHRDRDDALRDIGVEPESVRLRAPTVKANAIRSDLRG